MGRQAELTSSSKLYKAILAKQSYLCVGLDPDISKIPDCFGKGVEAVEVFCLEVINSTKHVAVAYKPNLAFFELFGSKGWEVLDRVIESIPSDCLVIADAKRGDIGNTSSKYAEAIFDSLGADAITVAPYMGADSVKPFTDRKDKWTILLALTSNPGADDFEFHGDTPLFEKVLSKAQEWGTLDNLMFVVGATRPEILARVRELAPSSFLLVPGVGAQGGTIERVAKFGLNARCGLLVNSSRGIIYAGENEETVEAAMSKTKAAAEDLATKMSETLRK
ncbi:MAG: orotidine-5'-phosphate decarboxylase [Crocinitomicaceae bacterium]|nr:orotidine-5'-phosphate decarboxylase [Crocinitomicaceae bacterium]|tara:strand:- start:6104 stop:6937 length:834 start_codon:yes stop_codon:yes gene_type:complete